MSKRTTADPLVRMFLDRYHLNLLAVPREGSAIGDLYVAEGKQVSAPGSVKHMFHPELVLPPVKEGEPMADITGVFTNAISADAGVSLLDGFLGSLGAGAVLQSIKAEMEAKKVRSLKFRIAAAVRDSVDPLALGVLLQRSKVADDAPFLGPQYRYYLVTAVARSRSISVATHQESDGGPKVSLGLAHVADVKGEVKITRADDGELTFTGEKVLAFGVELYELAWMEQKKQLKLKISGDAIPLRSDRDPRPLAEPAFIGGMDDDIFIRPGGGG